MKILVVDDSGTMRRVIVGSLNSLGYSDVLEASDGLEAQLVLDENKNINLILVDWNMPNMNGYELLQVVKKNETFKRIPVIMITTEAEKENVLKAIRAGASNYIIKPFVKEILAEKIKATFSK